MPFLFPVYEKEEKLMRKKEMENNISLNIEHKTHSHFHFSWEHFLDRCLAFVAVVVGCYSFNHYIFGIFAFGQMVSYYISSVFYPHQLLPHVCTVYYLGLCALLVRSFSSNPMKKKKKKTAAIV